MMIGNEKKMHTFRNFYATSDISFSKKDFCKIIFCGVWCAIPQAFCALVIDRMIFALGSFPLKSCVSWNRARPETSDDGRLLFDTALICGFESAYSTRLRLSILARTVIKRGHTGVYFPEAVITFFGIESYLVLTTFHQALAAAKFKIKTIFQTFEIKWRLNYLWHVSWKKKISVLQSDSFYI